jgi:predicted nuclease with TOPRIM domain
MTITNHRPKKQMSLVQQFKEWWNKDNREVVKIYSRMESELAQLQAKFHDVNEDLENVRVHNRKQWSELEEKKTQIKNLEAQLAAAQETIDKLTKTIKENNDLLCRINNETYTQIKSNEPLLGEKTDVVVTKEYYTTETHKETTSLLNGCKCDFITTKIDTGDR